MLFLDTPYLTIRWDEEIKFVHLTWRGFVEGDDFKHGLNKALELVALKGAKRWFADLREERVIKLEDQQWFTNEWYPRAEASTLKYMAVLEPQNALGRISIDRMRTRMNLQGPIEIVHFVTEEEVLQWLSTRPE